MRDYVLGFLFSNELHHVVLIRKNRPVQQAGKLNGIGGKVEMDQEETFDAAIVREFREETGVLFEHWMPFAKLMFSDGSTMGVYCGQIDSTDSIHSATDEEVRIYPVNTLDTLNQRSDVMPNLRWLIPMAQGFLLGEQVRPYFIQGE